MGPSWSKMKNPIYLIQAVSLRPEFHPPELFSILTRVYRSPNLLGMDNGELGVDGWLRGLSTPVMVEE